PAEAREGGPTVTTLLLPEDPAIERELASLSADEREAAVALASKTIGSEPIYASSAPLRERAWTVAISEARRTRGGEEPVELWSDPLPFTDLAGLPDFPVKHLPSWLGNFVLALSVETQTPLGLCGPMCLAVVAAAVHRKVAVHVRPGWEG